MISSPAWGWALIALGNIALITPYDVWLKLARHHTLTRQMHDWIFSPTIGPFIGATVAFLLVLGALHFLRYHPSGP